MLFGHSKKVATSAFELKVRTELYTLVEIRTSLQQQHHHNFFLRHLMASADPLHDLNVEVDLATQSLLLAAANHDVRAVRDLLRTTPATVQDADTGFTPLHAAVAAFDDADDGGEAADTGINGVPAADQEEIKKRELEAAEETVRVLLQNGAIWNDLDNNDETPGCIAWRLGLKELYEQIVDAGVRAELLLTRLGEYQPLADDDEDVEAEDEGQEGISQAGVQQELNVQSSTTPADPSASNEAYLSSTLTFTPTDLLDSATNAVMMSWETPIMERHASLLLPKEGLRVLNIGHGLGIIDNFFQSHSPTTHYIIEAHPDVLARMKQQGWYDKPGVVVHEGRWQAVLPKLAQGEGELVFDAIFFDTFAEDYSALREFFSESVVQFLDSEGRFGYFNGLGADRQICYDVYTKVAEMDLFEAGFDVEWEELKVEDLQERGEWAGIRRPYWGLETYKLPTCTFVG